MFALSVLLLGAVTTIAVAWGCRWVTDQRRQETRPLIPLEAREFNDAHPDWGGRWQYCAADRGGDGRRYVTNLTPPADWEADPSWDRGPYSVDVGVSWVAALSPGYETILETEGALLPERPWASPDPEDWPPTERDVVPWWSTVESEPLLDDGAVIQMGIGWPSPAFVVTHRLPRAPVPWFELRRETTGAWYGHPFDVAYRAQVPYRPLVLGFALNTVFWSLGWLLIVALVVFLPFRLRDAWRRGRKRCLHCGYRREGAVTTRCSECGALAGTRRMPWRLACAMTLTIAYAGIVAEIVYARSVCLHPTLDPVLQAVFDGDVETLRRIARDDPSRLEAEFPEELRVGGAYGGMVHDPPRPAARSALVAAMLGAQLEALRVVLDATGVDPPSPDGMMTQAQYDVLSCVTPFADEAFVRRIHDTYGWIIEYPEVRGGPRPVFFDSYSQPKPPHAARLALERMRIDPQFHRLAWGDAAHRAIRFDAWETAWALAELGPSGDRIRSDLWEVRHASYVSLADRYWWTTHWWPDRFPFRIIIARAMARAVEHSEGPGTDARQTVANLNALVDCMATEDDAGRTRFRRFLQEIEASAPDSAVEQCAFWESIVFHEIPFERFIAEWNALPHIASTLDPNVTARVTEYSPPLRGICAYSTDERFRIFLLDLGADVTDEICRMIPPAERRTITEWLIAHEQPVHMHDVRFRNEARR